MKKLQDIAEYVDERISSTEIELSDYVTTDCLLQNKNGRTIASNLPPVKCNLIKYQKNDILIANIRPYLKKIWYADRQGGASADVLVFRAKTSIDPLYLYAVFLQDSFYDYVMRATKGSKMPRGDKNHIMNYIIHPVSGAEEKRIGQIISNINTKIELNKKISRELEAMAKELYDYWFVQFDFPNEQGKPYKSSGGKMVWNETLKREIPEGWEVKKLGEICVFRNGINYDKGIEGNQEYRILNVRNISSSSLLVCETELDKISLPSFQADKYLLSSNDIVIARSGTPGATRLVWRINESTIFCGFIICSTPRETAYKIYLTYCLKKLEGTSATKTGGSTLQNVSQDTLKRLFVLIPDREIVRRFNTVISPILEKNYNNMKENYTLTRPRDYLLPLLMNGQVRVSQS